MPWIAKFIGDPSGVQDDLVENVYYCVKKFIPSNGVTDASVQITIHNLGEVLIRSERWCRACFKTPVWITDEDISSLVRESIESTNLTYATNDTELLNKMVNLKLIERFG